MTIDEAIQHAKEVAEKKRATHEVLLNGRNKSKYTEEDTENIFGCLACAEEHEQLAEWLKELKFIRQWKADVMEDFCKYDCRHNSYNKAIDECIRKINELTCGCTQEVWSHTICSVLEQLKGDK